MTSFVFFIFLFHIHSVFITKSLSLLVIRLFISLIILVI